MKTGIVWEGGAIRTIFSEGVNAALSEAGVDFDYAVGVSAGIAYGVSFLSGQPRRNLEIVTRFINDPRYMGARNLLDPTNRCYFGLHFTYVTVPNKLVPYDYDAFRAWPGEVEGVVTDLRTGGALYLPVRRDDKEFKLLQATCSLPLLFPIVHIGGAPCLDGGVADPIPFQRAFVKGCDRVLVVLTRERSYRKKKEGASRLAERVYRDYPNFRAAMADREERYNRQRSELFRLEREGRALVLAPESTAGFHRLERDLEKIRGMFQSGYDAAAARMDEIKAFLSGEDLP